MQKSPRKGLIIFPVAFLATFLEKKKILSDNLFSYFKLYLGL